MSQAKILRIAFIKSIPVLCSYIFLGTAYGILLTDAGLKWYHALFASAFVYTGAFQFVLTSLISSGASLLTVALTALLINSRQTFYALNFLPEFSQYKICRPYMIHSLTDETYAVNCTLTQTGEEKRRIMFPVALFSQLYWITGSLLGSILGQVIPFDMTGIDFCMTAMFVTVFMDQWAKAKKHTPALCGLGIGILCLLIFGGSSFMLPALLITSAVLVLLQQKEGDHE